MNLAFVAEATSSKGTSSTTSEARTHIKIKKMKKECFSAAIIFDI